jgi:polysaccharide biosynthesis transport protein
MPEGWIFENEGDPNVSWRPRHLFGAVSLRRHRRMVCLVGAPFLIAGLLFAVVRPMTYTASAQLLIYNREPIQGPESVIVPGRADTPLLESTIQIFSSRPVLTRVIGALRLDEDMEFAASDGPVLWRLARNWFAAPEDMLLDEHRLGFERTLEFVQRKLTISRVGTSHTILVNFTSFDPNKSALITNEIVRSASQALTNPDASPRASLLRERLHGLGPNAYAISTADPPIYPDGPRSLLIVMASSIAGLGLGAILALLIDFRDRTIRSSEQAEYFLGLECLGVIPRAQPGPTAGDQVTLDRLSRAQVVIDSIRGLRSLGVTSAVSGEGATFVALHLAQLSARRGKRVLIVDGIGRYRSPSCSGSEKEPWRSATVSGLRASIGDRFTGDEAPGVDIISIGNPTAPETDAAYWMRVDEALRQSASAYDLVIADLPALAPDVRVVARSLDGLLLVVKWGGTDAELIRRRLGPPGETCSKFVGVVLNMADQRLLGGYGDKLSEVEAALTASRRIRAGGAAELVDFARA